MLKPKSLVLLVVLVCIILPAVAQGEVTYLGNGQYKAVFSAITDDSTKADQSGSAEYYYDTSASTYKYVKIYTDVYVGKNDEMFSGRDNEIFRGYLEYDNISWEIEEGATIDSVFLTIAGDLIVDTIISFNIVSLLSEPPSSQDPESLWNSIGVGNIYATEIFRWLHELFPQIYKLEGAEGDFQDQLEDPFEDWFALGLRSNYGSGNQYLLEIKDDSLGVYFRYPPDITVLSPNGGEVLGGGNIYTISWSAEGDTIPECVDLYLIINGNTNYITRVYNTGNLNPWNGSYEWTVPETPSNNCKIKAVVYDEWGFEDSDESDDFFTIATPPTISIIWPNSQGIVLEEGETYGIRYDVPSATGGLINVKAYLSENGGNTWDPRVKASNNYDPPLDSVYDDTMDWTVADPPTSSGRLKLKAIDQIGLMGEKVNNYNFTIKMAKPSLADNYVTSYTSVHHSFIDNSEWEDYYQMYRREDSDSNWSLVATLDGHSGSGDIIEYEDEGLLPRKLYHYRIKAKKGSAYSNYMYKKNFTAPNWTGCGEGDFSAHNRCHFFVDDGIHLGYYQERYVALTYPVYRQLIDNKWGAPHPNIKNQGYGTQFSLRKPLDGNIWIMLYEGPDHLELFKLTENEFFIFPYDNTKPGVLKYPSDPIYNQGKEKIYLAYVREKPTKEPPPCHVFYDALKLNPDDGIFIPELVDSFSLEDISNYTPPVLSYNGNRMIIAYSIKRQHAGWETYLKKKSHSDTKWKDKAHIYGARFPSTSDNYLCYLKEGSLYIRNLNTSEEWSTSTGSLSNPFIYYYNGLVYLAYEKNGDIIYRVFSNNSFTDGYNLSLSPDTNSVYPEVYVNNDTVYVLYVEEYDKKEIRIKAIPCITVTDVTPLTDTSLTAGTTYKIQWNATTQYPAVSTKIYITRDGGNNWEHITSLSGDPGEYDWIVRIPSNNAQFRVEVYDERGSVGIGYSHTFTIADIPQCPLLHVYTDSGYIFDNSLLPRSEFIRKENLDRYKLSINPASEKGMLRFMITENKDITYIDNIKLLTVDHPEGIEVCVLPDGKVIAYEETNAEFKAVGTRGTDYTDSVKTREKGCWKGEKNDWLIIYKSSPNTDYVMTRGSPPKRTLGMSNNDTLYTRVRSDDIVIFNPDSILKYVAIDGSARIDYVNLVRKLPVRIVQMYAESYEMPQELLINDNKYYVINPGDSLYFSFKAPSGKNKDYEREYIILTRGYYTERKGSKGPLDNKPEIKYRNEIRLVQSIGRIVLEVESEKDRTIDIKIYDVVGRKIDSKTFDMRRGIRRVGIDVHSSGVYFITTDKEILKAMVIK